ncbi:hypothetical protein A4R26_26015 [Niastella populi]|uniref:Uncharacterized protein n=1 Tax=Niastella populi TaxID=550983 RepID=A0A1V9FDH4_9BACT|nr:hypothetical protein A4R26_26015 [Niastella populi]
MPGGCQRIVKRQESEAGYQLNDRTDVIKEVSEREYVKSLSGLIRGTGFWGRPDRFCLIGNRC